MRSLHFACLILLFILSCKKTDLNGTRYEDEVFDKVKSEKNIEYGENINFVGINEKLHLDIYEPKGDNETNRPVIFFTHGGGFITGSKTDQCIVKFCKDFAKKGYVTVSMHYRIGIALPVNEQHGLEAVIRAMHDAKAAVRFIRKTAGEDGNPYNIDPDQIYFAGISAGAITGLQAAYLDQESELPVEVDFSKKSLKGGLEGST
ncbi:MAG: alpha/beta hydrolase, partial [Flavobacteriales bacterium]|nr:alpha/beta hydrolase [Flavobacteriales bacterium]